MVVKVSPAGRDLVFDFKDSCNCKCSCFGKKKEEPHENALMYVRPNGVVERFDPGKADDEKKRLEESVANLRAIIHNLSEEQQKDHSKALEAVETHIDEKLHEQPYVTWGLLQRVSGAVSSIFFPTESTSVMGAPKPIPGAPNNTPTTSAAEIPRLRIEEIEAAVDEITEIE